MENLTHVPVMAQEAVSFIVDVLPQSPVVVDGTLGGGGHARLLAKALKRKNGRLICFDLDEFAIERAQSELAEYRDVITFVQGNFSGLGQYLVDNDISGIHGLLLDLGVSSFHLDDPARGFSFMQSGPLDMRMGSSVDKTAADVVNTYSEHDLYEAIRTLGEERWARRIARGIVARRPFATTDQLVAAIVSSVPPKFRHGRIHAATRTFQALRMEVNEELTAIESILNDLPRILAVGGTAVVISFHSLEDRLVKLAFREMRKSGFEVLTKKPLGPNDDEVERNRRSRSAKLRAVRRVAEVSEEREGDV